MIEWIPVEKRWPEDSRSVLVTLKLTTVVTVAWCLYGKWTNYGGKMDSEDAVIAWAELPAPYVPPKPRYVVKEAVGVWDTAWDVWRVTRSTYAEAEAVAAQLNAASK